MPLTETTQHTRTILLIDDEDAVRYLVKLLLEGAGYRVLTAPNGEAGCILAKSLRPDVILLDILMPKMNGYDTLKQLARDPETRAIPVIMLTAKGSQHDIDVSFHLGAICHIEKPYDTTDLLQKIQVALARKTSPPSP